MKPHVLVRWLVAAAVFSTTTAVVFGTLFFSRITDDAAVDRASEAEAMALFRDRSDALDAMNPEECVKLDHFDYLGLNALHYEGRVTSQGAVFSYDCMTGFWGWYHDGGSAHWWTSRITMSDFGPDIDELRLPLEASGAPTSLRHPAYPDAVTLDEIVPGQQYCLVNSSHRRYVEQEQEQTFTIAGIFANYFLSEAPGGADMVTGGPAFDFVLDDSESDLPHYFSELGVIPDTNGQWSEAHFRAGAC